MVNRLMLHSCMMVALAGLAFDASAQATDNKQMAKAETPSGSRGTAPSLKLAYTSNRVWNAVTVADDGRVFASFPYWGGGSDQGPTVTELAPDGKPTAYPDAAWNSWKAGGDAAHTFVRVNAIRIGPEGHMWVVDAGEATLSPDKDIPSSAAKGKLVEIDMATNTVVRTIDMGPGSAARTYIDDIRFAGNYAFLTDAGDPGLVVLNLTTGEQRRVLEHTESTTDRRPMYAEGKMLMSEGKQVRIHADQLEVSPDQQWLYYQASSGPLYRVSVAALEDKSLSAKQLNAKVKLFYDTPTTGGTVIDGDGNVYVSDVNKLRIIKLTPEGKASVFLDDKRLVWADAMWIDKRGTLWIPAVQLNRTPNFQGGVSKVKYPVAIYSVDLGLKPAR